MSTKTDSPEFGSGFLWQVCLLTIVALLYVLFSYKLVPAHDGGNVSYPQPIMYPWMFPEKLTIENSLHAFGGRPPQVAGLRDQANAIGTILVTMILCPTIFLLEWRRRKLAGHASDGRPPLKTSSVLYAFTGAITIYIGIGILPTTYFLEQAHKNTRRAQAIQSNRDAIINELYFLDFRLEQYFILPKSLGGGDGTFEGFTAAPEVMTTKEATYVLTAGKNQAELKAVSVQYPSAWVKVHVDTARHLSMWQYGGEFR